MYDYKIRRWYQIKKIVITLSIFLLMIGIVGCAGVGDYEIELINGFKVRRTSAQKVHIGSSEYSYDELLIPILDDYEKGEFIEKVCHDNDRYIIAKTNFNNYYVLDTKKAIVQGPLTKEKYIKLRENLQIPNSIALKDLSEYKKIR